MDRSNRTRLAALAHRGAPSEHHRAVLRQRRPHISSARVDGTLEGSHSLTTIRGVAETLAGFAGRERVPSEALGAPAPAKLVPTPIERRA